jgi:AraC-like DNA-binding protein
VTVDTPIHVREPLRFQQPRDAGMTWFALPSTTVTVIINLGEPFGGLPGAFVAGLTDRGTVVDQHGEIDCLDLKLTPLGAYQLFGVPMSELANQIVDLTDVARLRPDRLREDLARLTDEGPEPAPEVTHVWRRLHDAHGNIPITELAGEVGWSRRHLVNRFHAQVGLPPKTVARILRFEELLRRLPTTRIAEAAATCGYYDQAHMNRDFREFAGTTPGDYLTRFPSVQYPWVPAT